MTELEMKIDDYMKHAHHPQVNSILVWEQKDILAELYYNRCNADSRHPIKSVVKSILSAAIGIAEMDGLLCLGDPIGKYIPEFRDQRDVFHRRITIQHLLTMSSGIFWQGGVHYHCPQMDGMRRSKNWIDYIADCKVVDIPGKRHNYKEWDVILLAQILSCVAGDCYDYINDRLYTPLGIRSERWYQSPDGVYYSVALNEEKEAWSNLTARDMLKLGILFLHNGIWEGKQILSEEYIQKATAPSPQDTGYGFLWWVGDGWYGCRGFGGQTVTVFPERGRIIVTQASVTNRPLSYNDVIYGVAMT